MNKPEFIKFMKKVAKIYEINKEKEKKYLTGDIIREEPEEDDDEDDERTIEEELEALDVVITDVHPTIPSNNKRRADTPPPPPPPPPKLTKKK